MHVRISGLVGTVSLHLPNHHLAIPGWNQYGSKWVVSKKKRHTKSALVVLGCKAVETDDKLSTTIVSPSPSLFKQIGQQRNAKLAFGVCVGTTILVLVVRAITSRRRNNESHSPGSVADLVRRGQLRSDTRGIRKGVKYEDPFNNPMVKEGKSDSTVEMCGKVYRVAAVTLTEEQRAVHQKRRSRAYQWKRPTVFLKEGDVLPPNVDPDTVRWIPANHPFATTVTDIDEDVAHTNVAQKHGVPFRIRAEHEALQLKLQALQNEQKLNNLTLDPSNAKDFERAFKPNNQNPSQNDSDEMQKP